MIKDKPLLMRKGTIMHMHTKDINRNRFAIV